MQNPLALRNWKAHTLVPAAWSPPEKEALTVTLSSSSPVGAAGALALDAFARDSAADSAIDSVVYDLRAYDASVPASDRFVAISRDGIYGFYADADVAAMAVSNRRSFVSIEDEHRAGDHSSDLVVDCSLCRAEMRALGMAVPS